MKLFFFLFFLIPLVSAKFNCTYLYGEQEDMCRYIKRSDLSNSEKQSLMQEILEKGSSLNGDFSSINLNNNPFQISDADAQEISEETKQIIKETLSLSLFGYIIFQFLKKYFSQLWVAE